MREEAMRIRSAEKEDHQRLTAISFAAKSLWPYPKEYFRAWKAELTITPEYIGNGAVYLVELESEIVGYYSLIGTDGQALHASKTCNLDHIYVMPGYIGKKIGTALFQHAKSTAKKNGHSEILALVDPYATGFYEKMGAVRLCDTPSNIPGRSIPVYRIDCI